MAHLPAKKVIGLSRISRLVDMFARRLQVQERMTSQIADFLEAAVKSYGVAVVIEGLHLCAMMQGVKKANARMITSAMTGTFRSHEVSRQELPEPLARGTGPVAL